MEDVCGGTKPYLGVAHLDAEHLRIKDKAIHQVCLDHEIRGTNEENLLIYQE